MVQGDDKTKGYIKVSAVIPVYNCEKYIEEAINSLIKQTYPLFEVIVIDDKSTDKTYNKVLKLVNETNGWIRLYKHDSNKGVSKTRNLGIRKAKGEWILFMDGDDILKPELVETQIRHFEDCKLKKPNQWVLVHSAYNQIIENGVHIDGVYRFKQVDPEEILGYELVRNQVVTTGTLVKKEEIEKLGGFDESLAFSEDWDMWLRLAQVGGFIYVNEPLFYVRRHTGNASKRINDMLIGERKVLQKYDSTFIQSAIYKRRITEEQNAADYVSILYKLDLWEEGYQFLKRQESKNFAPFSFLKGLYYLHHNHINKAKSSFINTINIDSQHGAALNNLGAICILLKQYKDALAFLQCAISLFPDYIDANHNIKILKTSKTISFNNLNFTWRELRNQLTIYKE